MKGKKECALNTACAWDLSQPGGGACQLKKVELPLLVAEIEVACDMLLEQCLWMEENPKYTQHRHCHDH